MGLRTKRVISDIVKRRSFRVSWWSQDCWRYALPVLCLVARSGVALCRLMLDRRSRRIDLASWSF